jgi:hypothetical protein
MVLLRMLVFALIGLGFVALLCWVTNWPFAVFCWGVLMAGVAAHQAGSASPLDLPGWMSSGGAKLVLSLIGLFSLVSPFLIGVIWFRWWWGLVGYVLGGLGAGLSQPILPGIPRLLLGLLLSLGAAVAFVR